MSTTKPRICVISFSQVSQLMASVAGDYAHIAEVVMENRRFGDALSQAQALIDRGDVDVFVSAGANGALLRRRLNYPVVLINVTGYDIMRALIRAAHVSDHIGLVTYEPVSPELEDLGDLLKIKLQLCRYTNEQDAHQQLRSLREMGVKVVIGPSIVTEVAPRYGLQSIFLYTPESARHALEEAIEVARVRAVEHQRRQHLASILGHLREGVIALSYDQKIWLANRAACQLLEMPFQVLEGMSLSQALPQLDVQDILFKQKKPLLRQVFSIGDRRMVGNIIPIDDMGMRQGVLLTMQEASTIERAGRDLLRHAQIVAPRARHTTEDLVGESLLMRRLRSLVTRFAGLDLTVLITGESGTGKELIAQSLHNASIRRHNPFVAINCAAMPESLLESELFGYEEGAFTGAIKGGKAGLFEAAHRGSVFLDEIGDMPMGLQSRLLRVLQEREVLRIGGREPTAINVRIIAATHRDLAQSVAEGIFREDLYYRLNGLRILAPSLREHTDDLSLLLQALIRKNIHRHGFKPPSHELIRYFLHQAKHYHWAGNVRELENMVERLMAVACEREPETQKELLTILFPELEQQREETMTGLAPSDLLKLARQQAEQETLSAALQAAGGNMSLAAKKLGIGRTTLWRKLGKGK